MSEFFSTRAGQSYQHNIGRIAKALERIADSMEKGVPLTKEQTEQIKAIKNNDGEQ